MPCATFSTGRNTCHRGAPPGILHKSVGERDPKSKVQPEPCALCQSQTGTTHLTPNGFGGILKGWLRDRSVTALLLASG